MHQKATWAHVSFEDESVADFFDAQVDAGRLPEEFGRIWIHTHPGSSAQPSQTDEETFSRVFGRATWALMFILARGGQSYARLRYNVGPGTDILIPVDVDCGRRFGNSDAEGWHQEYAAHVRVPPPTPRKIEPADPRPASVEEPTQVDDWYAGQPPADWYEDWSEYSDMDNIRKEAEFCYVRDF